LFGNNSVVKVSNIASGGASSEVGKVVLEYKLFPAQVKKDPVHVVIWAHAPNDAHESDKDRVFYEYLPGFVNAARSLDNCNENFPMVVILEDFYGFQSYGPVNEVSGYLSELSSWYRLLSVNQANVIKHALWANFDNPQVISHILGGDYNLHSGMGHHAGVAWTMLYNFLSAFIDSCTAETVGVEIPPSFMPLKFLGAYDTSGKYDKIRPTWWKNKEDAREYCSKQMLSTEINEPCTYAFMANTMAGMWNPRALRIKMQGVLKASDGWEASGDPISHPRLGWTATKEGATFSLLINASYETKFMTFLSLKSYGPNFANTVLEINVTIIRKEINQHTALSYEITGYHETNTSIYVPHKFELPGGGAKIGDSIVLDAKLKSGANFKINGMAFCTE